MHRFNAVLYGGDLAPAGANTEAGFESDSLHIVCGDMRIALNAISLRVGGFGHDELHLDWTDAAGESFTLKPRSADDIAFVVAHAPPSLQRQMPRWHKRRLSIRVVWSTLATLTVVIAACAGLLWWRYDEVLTWAANQVSVENEQRLGKQVLEQLEADEEIIREGAAIDAIKTIGGRLTENSRFEYQWYVQKNRTVNAFALPGGIIVVNSALLLDTDSAEELAGVLAHEVQHVEGRHVLKSMLNSLGFATVLLVVLGDVNAATAVIVHQVGNMYFSRDIEEEADVQGFYTLVKAGISPAGMISFFKKLQKEYSDTQGSGMEWLSTHPETAKRISKIQALYDSEPCPACKPLELDWVKVLADPLLAGKEK